MRFQAISAMIAPTALTHGMHASTMATTANAETVPGGVDGEDCCVA